MATYYEIPASAVPHATIHVVERTVRAACDDLDIAYGHRPVIRWFTEEDDAERALVAAFGEGISCRLTAEGTLEGRCERGENAVWIRASAPLAELPVTAAHEVAHIALWRTRGPGVTESERAHQEALAEAYGLRYRQEDP